MSLDEKYDKFYLGDGRKEIFGDIRLSGWPKNRTDAIIYQAGSGGSVLDIGCGNGYLLHQLRNRFETLYGIEYSAERLKQAVVNLEGLNFKPLRGSAEDMNMVDNESVDVIISADTIEHIPDVYMASQEMWRVLKPGGRLVINTPNIAFIKKRLLLLLGRFPSTSQPNEGLGSDILFDGGHLHYFTFRSLKQLFERVGFKHERRIGFGKLGTLHNFYPGLLSGGVQIEFQKHL